MTTIRKATLFATSAMLTVASLQAQQGTMIDERWRPFLGCWISSSAGMAGPMVCMVPTSQPSTVEMLAVVRDSIVSRTPITASGAKVETNRDGCVGWESAQWSADDRRLMTTSEFTCSGQALQKASGIYAMKQGDEFARVEGIKTRTGTRVRIMNFLLQDDTTRIPKEIVLRLPRVGAMPQLSSRLEAAADLTSADVAEAAEKLDAPVVEAWLADRGQAFALSAKDLIALHELHTPESVIDMMVAVSNPDVFSLAAGGKPAARSQDEWMRRRTMGRAGTPYPNGATYGRLDDYGWNPYFPMGLYSYSPYDLYSSNCLGGAFLGVRGVYYNSNCGSWYGLYPPRFVYGGYNGGWIPGNSPIVIVPVNNLPPTPPGIVQKGRGYTQGGGGGDPGRSGVPSPSVGTGSGGGGGGSSSSGGSASTGSSSSGSASSGSEQRTAKPRP